MREACCPFVVALLLIGKFVGCVGAEEAFHKVEGRYIQLVTNLPKSAAIESYVVAFDQAVPLWVRYWNRDLASVNGWRLTGYLMAEKADFLQHGLVPKSLADFANGYQVGNKLWVVNQPSEYYTLHLLLHEGVHGLSQRLFGGSGPPWYMEGTAEFLATHRLGEAGLQVGIVPQSKETSPYWGRIGLIQERREEGKIPTIETIMRYGDTAHREVEPYAWSWAASLLMEMYPEYRERFRDAARRGRDASPQFTREFYQSLRQEWSAVSTRWQLLCNDLEYGIDLERNRVSLDPPQALSTREPVSMVVKADQGWQAAPVKVAAGALIRIEATGRFQLENDEAWVSQADGVTITYYRGIPLGRLIACVVPEAPAAGPFLPKLEIFSVGATAELKAPHAGRLFLKINDSPAVLADNRGHLDLHLTLVGR
jgi:hypothetical protein